MKDFLQYRLEKMEESFLGVFLEDFLEESVEDFPK